MTELVNAKTRKAKNDAPPLRLEWWPASRLAEHPRNWRIHGDGQASALRAMLDRVGWAGACLFNETTGRLIDGHLRKKLARRGERVPVLVGRWTEQQEQEILVTLDPLAGMADADPAALGDLLAGVDLSEAGMTELAATLAAMASGRPDEDEVSPSEERPVGVETQPRLDQRSPVTCPKCGHVWTPR